ncbi:hypothetical protein K6V90_09355 [Cupriavidus pauculus]|uniref:hypothetical protein n=1 Tax=Cupriavidus pauculus TaxID=82633 RepID=UPI001C933617|nr:hypothetical protein [Cupriavidus pauculus]MBY4730737.1 hypothetical protein [Cupriavidus pauculus]
MAEIDPLAFQRGFQGAQSAIDSARQNRLAQLVFDQKQQEINQQNALASVLGNTANYDPTGNLKREALPQIASAAPGKVPEFQQMYAQQATQQRAAEKAQRDQLIAQFDWADKNMAGVQDQAGWDAFRQRAAQVYPDIAAKLPAQYDPASIQASRARMIPVLEQWKQEQENARFQQGQQTTRRGQDLSAQTATRGQDITLRGQDMADARARETLVQNAANKAPTEFQGKSAGYGARAEEADRIIGSLVNASPMAVNAKQAAGRVPLVGGVLETIGNAALSPQNQQLEQAQRDFVNATLRQESGAAISQSEFENAKRQYFPQPGDSAEVIAQKAANRKLAIEGFKRSAGKAAFSAPGGKPKPSLADIFGN